MKTTWCSVTPREGSIPGNYKGVNKEIIMNLIDETERNVLLQDLKRLDAKKESLTKQLKETNQEIDKLEKKLKDLSRK